MEQPKIIIYGWDTSWREALKTIKFGFVDCERDEGNWGEIPDTMLFGTIDVLELYDILKINSNIDFFCGELSFEVIPNKRALNIIKNGYEVKEYIFNLKEFGFNINKKVRIVVGIKKDINADVISIYQYLDEMLDIYKKSIPKKRIGTGIIDYKNSTDIPKIVEVFGYPQTILNNKTIHEQERFLREIQKESPPQIYKLFYNFLYASVELHSV